VFDWNKEGFGTYLRRVSSFAGMARDRFASACCPEEFVLSAELYMVGNKVKFGSIVICRVL